MNIDSERQKMLHRMFPLDKKSKGNHNGITINQLEITSMKEVKEEDNMNNTTIVNPQAVTPESVNPEVVTEKFTDEVKSSFDPAERPEGWTEQDESNYREICISNAGPSNLMIIGSGVAGGTVGTLVNLFTGCKPAALLTAGVVGGLTAGTAGTMLEIHSNKDLLKLAGIGFATTTAIGQGMKYLFQGSVVTEHDEVITDVTGLQLETESDSLESWA